MLHYTARFAATSPAHRKLEGIIVQWLAAARLHHHCGAKLQSGFEIFGDWVGLDDVNHVFFERPFLQRMHGGFRTELWGLAGFAVENAVVASEAVIFDGRRGGDDLFAGSAGFTNLADALVALISSVEQFAVSWRRLFADSERPVNLRRVAPVADGQFSNYYATFFEYA